MKRRCKFLWKTKVRKGSNTSFKTIFGILQQSTIGFHSISNFSKNDQDLKHFLCKWKKKGQSARSVRFLGTSHYPLRKGVVNIGKKRGT